MSELGLAGEEGGFTKPKERISETGAGGGSKSGSGSYSTSELADYAADLNLDISNPVVKQKAIKGLIAMKKTEI